MYIPQKELFWGLNQNVVNRVMAIAERKAFNPGDVLFHSGDAAQHLYILAQGEIRITMDKAGKCVYTGNRVGEAFGWGCLINSDTYGGSAVCQTPAVVLKIDRERLLKLFDDDMESGYLFFRHLSCALGCRLVQACQQTPPTD